MGRKMQNEAEWLGERELTLQEEAPWESREPGKGFVGWEKCWMCCGDSKLPC